MARVVKILLSQELFKLVFFLNERSLENVMKAIDCLTHSHEHTGVRTHTYTHVHAHIKTTFRIL